MDDQFTENIRAEARAIIEAPKRMIEYRLCARLEIPCVAAIVHEISEAFPHLKRHDKFKQWVGKEVAKRMGSNYEVLRERGRVPWCNFFTYGAVYKKRPN